MPDAGAYEALRAADHATFAAHVGETFRMRLDGGISTELQLIEVTPGGARATELAQAEHRRAPFSLLFREPTGRRLPQRIYVLEHERLGELGLFLVPLGPDRQGMRYEAVFT